MNTTTKRLRWMAPAAAMGMVLASVGTAAAASKTPALHGVSGAQMKSVSKGVLRGVPSDVLVGAATSPAMGMGTGTFYIDSIGKKMTWRVPLSMGANAFQSAIVGSVAYVPTMGGKTYVVSLVSHKVTKMFMSPMGDRAAVAAPANHLLLLFGSTNVTAYSLPSLKKVWQLDQGGNALTVAGHNAYLSGNAASTTSVINLGTGHVAGSIAVGHIEDAVYDPERHTLWLANWTNGDMTIVNTRNNRVLKTVQRAEGGGFNMNNMMGSMGGFMQLAVAPSGRQVYAASFSGNVMVYNAMKNSFAKDIPVGSMARLSGIAVDPSGQYAYVTVENQKRTVSISLKTDKVVSSQAGLLSNRWSVAK